MRYRPIPIFLTIASMALMTGPVMAATSGVSVYTFAPEGLAAASNKALAGSVSNDYGILLGGSSDLYRVPGKPAEYWTVTDRGPNVDTVMTGGAAGLGFAVPGFSPLIMKVSVTGQTVSFTDKIAVQSVKGVGVTGLPNIAGYDSIPTNVSGVPIGYNPNGLDAEGVVRTANGDFWLVDEYAPSLIQVGPDGVVKSRLVPQGWKGTGLSYPVVQALPAVFLNRKVNRGFEAIALSPSEKYLFIGLQSPLLNPDKKTGDASMQTRILRMNLATKAIDLEWVHRFEPVETIDASTTKTTELKVSAMVALNDNLLLVQERTDNAFVVAQVSLSPSQSILGSAYDTSNSPTLESLKPTDSTLATYAPSKSIIFRSTSVPEMPKKVEGMAVENANTLAFTNDNDFAFTYDAKTDSIKTTGVPLQFLYVTLAQALPTTPDAEVRKIKAAATLTAKSGTTQR